jgi:hypothetical protein
MGTDNSLNRLNSIEQRIKDLFSDKERVRKYFNSKTPAQQKKLLETLQEAKAILQSPRNFD